MASRGFSPVVVCGLLVAVACHGGFSCFGVWTSVAAAVSPVVAAPRLQSTGSVVVARGLSCPEASGIFPDQGWNQCLLNCKADFQPLDHQGSPRILSVDSKLCN